MLARMKNNRPLGGWWVVLATLVCTMCGPASAQEAQPLHIFDKGGTRARIESCVSHDAIEFSIGHNSALLDADDSLLVSAAMRQRYPALRADGFAPSHVMLWQRPGADWLYVTLLANPQKPGEVCFTATFSATVFEQTPGLLKKYFASSAART
jgi:hypothetical protein